MRSKSLIEKKLCLAIYFNIRMHFPAIYILNITNNSSKQTVLRLRWNIRIIGTGQLRHSCNDSNSFQTDLFPHFFSPREYSLDLLFTLAI